MGKLHYFLGMQVLQDQTGGIRIGQPNYTENLLRKINVIYKQDSKTASTPADPSQKPVKAADGKNV